MNPQPKYIRHLYVGSDKLKDKVALITGGDSGIGRAVAIHFAREGANVAIVYLPEEETDARETKRLVEAEGRQCLTLSGDLRKLEFCEQVVADTIARFGKLNILVNNAAVQYQHPDLEQIRDEDLLKTFETNIYAQFRVTRAAVPHLHEGDSIINTTSITAYQGRADLLDYSSTKGAIMTFTRALSSNLAKKKIRVNAVAPGPILWPDADAPGRFAPQAQEHIIAHTLLKREGRPDDIARTVRFLLDDAPYVTGQVINVDGGRSAHL